MAYDRDELLAKMADALADNPGCTMKELAETVGISKASLHRIYTNKENICQQLGEKEQEILKDLKAVIKAKKKPGWRIYRRLLISWLTMPPSCAAWAGKRCLDRSAKKNGMPSTGSYPASSAMARRKASSKGTSPLRK